MVWMPLLFLVYIDDVSDTLLSDGSVLNLYADDMLLYKPVSSPEDFRHLQSDIDHIGDWVSRNNLTLNPNKCKTMIISRKRNSVQPPQLILNGLNRSKPSSSWECFFHLISYGPVRTCAPKRENLSVCSIGHSIWQCQSTESVQSVWHTCAPPS